MGLLLASVTAPDAVTFAIAAVITVGGALGVVFFANPVHCALSLVATLFAIAVLFIEQDAQFLAAVQIIVYSGAIVVMFLFVIMLLGVDRREKVIADTFKGQRVVAVVIGIIVLVEVIVLGSGHWATGAHSVAGRTTGASNVVLIGQSLFTTYLLPFEVTSALLVVAIIAAVVLARRPSDQPIPEGDEDDFVVGADSSPSAPLPTEGSEVVTPITDETFEESRR